MQNMKKDPINTIEQTPSVKMALAVLLIGLLAIIPAWMNYDIIARDAVKLYVPVANMFMQGRFHDAIWGPLGPLVLPLYEFLIFVVAKISDLDLETSGRLISAFSFVLGTLGIYKATEVIFKDRVVALISVLFFISNRELLWRSVDCLKESLLVCLVIWGNYFILRWSYNARKNKYIIFGAFLLLAGGLVRSTSIIFLGVWLIIWVFHKKDGAIKRAVFFLFLTISVFLIYYFNHNLYWGLPVFRRSYNLSKLISNNLSIQEHMILSLDMTRQMFAKSYYLIGFFSLIGIYWRKRETYIIHLVIVALIFFAICVKTTWVLIDRYTIVLVIWLYPIASYALVKSLRSMNKPLKVMAVITIVMCPVLWGEKVFTPPDADKLARKEAGLWILDRLGPDQVIISNRDRLVFYAQGKYMPLSKYKAGDSYKRVLAVDTKYEEGRIIVEEAHSRGIDPDKQFRSISIYLPKS